MNLTDEDVLTLECPICTEEKLHIKKISISGHDEQRESGIIQSCTFWCELCGADSVLIMGNSKGAKLIYWHEDDYTQAP